MSGKPTQAVNDMAKLNITGNVIPNCWWSVITMDNGKPDCIGCLVLSEICYWYRPKEERDEKTGRSLPMVKKFDADMWQCSYQAMADKFGFSKRQVKDAIDRLVKRGLIATEFRTIRTKKTTLNNVLFIEPIVLKITNVTYGLELSEKDTPPTFERKRVVRLNVGVSHVQTEEGDTFERRTYTETPSEIPSESSTEINRVSNNTVREKNRNAAEVVAEQAAVMGKSEAKALFSQLVAKATRGKAAQANANPQNPSAG